MKRLLTVLCLAVMFCVVGCSSSEKTSSGQVIYEETIFYGDDQGYLVERAIPVKEPIDAIDGMKVVKAIIDGPTEEGLYATLPEGTTCLSYEYNEKNKQAVVNFNEKILEAKGSTGEMLAVYSVVNSLTMIEGIDEVQFLVEGNSVETLSGHMYMANPLTQDLSSVK